MAKIADILKQQAVAGGKKAYLKIFEDKDIISSFMRKLVEKKKSDKSPEKEDKKDGGISEEGMSYLRIIAKATFSLHLMARDMNVLRQNIVKLVKLKGGTARQGADRFFLREDERESALEASRKKIEKIKASPIGKEGAPVAGESGGILSFLSNFIAQLGIQKLYEKYLKKYVVQIFKFLIKPQNIIKVIKIGIRSLKIGTVAMTGGLAIVIWTAVEGLIFGIIDSIKTIFDGGSISDVLYAFFGAFVEAATFGFFDKTDLKGFLDPIIDDAWQKIQNAFSGIKEVFAKITGKSTETPVKQPETPGKPPEVPGKPPEAPSKPPEVPGKPPETPGKPPEAPSKPPEAPVEESRTPKQTPKEETYTPPKPTPAPKPEVQQKTTSPEKINLPEGWQVDPTTGYYIFPRAYELLGNIRLNPETTTQEDINKINQQFLDKEKEQKDKIEKIGQQNASKWGAKQSTPSSSSSMSSTGGEVTASPSPTSSSPSPSASSPNTGNQIMASSSDVAEGQRMESAADTTSVVNAPVTTNSSSVSGRQSKSTTSVYDTDLVSMLATT